MNRAALPLFWLLSTLLMRGTTYHVDGLAGDDKGAGTSPEIAWKTLDRVNRETFRPGDTILFQSGQVWRGRLWPRGSGVEGAPIRIDCHGKGSKPRIDAAGTTEDAVRLYNQQHWEIRNLEITNHGEGTAIRRGVHVFLDNFGTGRHIVLSGLVVHDVNGDNRKKDNGGIIWRTNGDKKPSRFAGLTIERNVIYHVDRSAIAAESYHWDRRRWFPSLNVVIRDNFVDDIGGDGIVPWATDGVLVEHNIARNVNRRAGSDNAGIWPWSCDNSRFQWNEASLTRTRRDAQGFDVDFNSSNTLFQFNYGHDNEGGFITFCTPAPDREEGNLGNTGIEIRYNISRNDRARTFHIAGPVANVRVHDNAIYVGQGLEVQMLLLSDWGGWAEDVEFRDNLFIVEGTARYGHGTKKLKDGSFQMAPGYGLAKQIVFAHNQYSGRHIDRPEDEKAIVQAEAKIPAWDWQGPEYDPQGSGDFDVFIEQHRRWMRALFEVQFGKAAIADALNPSR